MDAAVVSMGPQHAGQPVNGMPENGIHRLFFYPEGLGGKAEYVSSGTNSTKAGVEEKAERLVPEAALKEARAFLETMGPDGLTPCLMVVVMQPPESRRLQAGMNAPLNLAAGSPIVQKALAYVDEQYTQALSASALARQLKVTTSYLCRIFKAETGDTISGRLAERRVREAAKLLQTDLTLSIKEIAFAVGFGSLPQFNRVFRRHTSLSPRDYRRQAKHPVAASEELPAA